jgi:hypothetical protein
LIISPAPAYATLKILLINIFLTRLPITVAGMSRKRW